MRRSRLDTCVNCYNEIREYGKIENVSLTVYTVLNIHDNVIY